VSEAVEADLLFPGAELFQTAVNAFSDEYAEVVPPSDCEESATARTAEKVETKPGNGPDQAEKHENWELDG
jgi:hypothetical protein